MVDRPQEEYPDKLIGLTGGAGFGGTNIEPEGIDQPADSDGESVARNHPNQIEDTEVQPSNEIYEQPEIKQKEDGQKDEGPKRRNKVIRSSGNAKEPTIDKVPITDLSKRSEEEDEDLDEDFGLCALSGGASNNDGSSADKKTAVLQQLHQNIRQELSGHTWEITSYTPLKFIIAHTDHKQIIYGSIRNKKTVIRDGSGNETEKYEIVPHLKLCNIIIGAIPTEVIAHENPLGFTDQKYTIRFFTHTNRQINIRLKTLEEIVAVLREKALVFASRGALEALAIVIGAFAKDEKIIVNDELETPGFYLVGAKIKSYHANHPKPTEEAIQKCTNLLDELASRYKRKDVFATLIKWSVVAPFDYALKQSNGGWIHWLHPYGVSNTGKTCLGQIACAIWGKYQDTTYKIPFTSMDTVAKFGEVLSSGTYPVTVNEVGALNDDKYKPLVEMVKNAVETQTARSKFIRKINYTEIPALCACILTSNTQPPSDTGYRRRVILIPFTRDDEHTAEEMHSFEQLMSDRVGAELFVLGDFAANFVLDHQREIILDRKRADWKSVAKRVLQEFYYAAMRQPPDWVEYFIEETQLADSKEDSDLILRGFFINVVNNTYRQHHKSIDSSTPEIPNLPFSARLNFIVDQGLVPFLNRGVIDKGEAEGIILTSDLMQELRRLKMDSSISSLAELARMIPGFEYGQKKLGKKNVRAAYGHKLNFLEFLNAE